MGHVVKLLSCLLVFSMSIGSLAARDLIVGKGEAYTTLWSAVNDAKPGEIIVIKEGVYSARDIEIPMDLTIIGIGDVTITSRRPVAKGLLVPTRGSDLVLRNLTFKGARAPDKNGAGIRFEGKSLRISHCRFIENDDGILATGSPDTRVTIGDSEFIDNGFGDGYSHGIYINKATYLSVENSLFKGTKIGHHIKSMATRETVILNNVFTDDNGQPSYVVDVTKGGNARIENNTITRSENASQENVFNYDTSRGGEPGTLVIGNNKIESHKRKINLLRNPLKVAVDLSSNDVKMLKADEVVSTRGEEDVPLETDIQDPVEEFFVEQAADVTLQDIDEEPAQTLGTYKKEQLGALTPTQRRAVEKLQKQKELQAAPKEHSASKVAVSGLRTTPRILPRTTPKAQLEEKVAPPPAPKIVAPLVSNAQNQATVSPVRQRLTKHRFPQPRGMVTLPKFASSDTAGFVAAVNLVPRAGANNNILYTRFGHVFTKGQLAKNAAIALKLSDKIYPAQLDAKAFYEDGSVRHGVVTVLAPKSTSTINGALVRASKSLAGQSSLPSNYNITVDVRGSLVDGTPFQNTVNLSELGERDVWQNGPLAHGFSVSEDIGPFLTLRADITVYGNQYVSTRLTFENHKSFATGNRDLKYDVSVMAGEINILQRSIDKHYRGSNWSTSFWKGGRPLYDVQQDPKTLVASYALPPLDLSVGVAPTAVSDMGKKLAESTDAPFEHRLLTPYFPTSGARYELGMLPLWDIYALKTQNIQAIRLSQKMADVSGAMPWHFEQDGTGLPVRVDQHTTFWSEPRGVTASAKKDRLPDTYFAGSDGGFTLNVSHKPNMAYYTYLTSGDPYFLREFVFEAAFAVSNIWPDQRKGKLLVVEATQLRTRAWALRDIGNAAWGLPDRHPLKDYFKTAVRQNLAHLRKSYVADKRMKAAGALEGYFHEEVDREPNRISPWQNDYLVVAVAQEALRGSKDAAEVIRWTMPYQVGRFVAAGASPKLAPASAHIVRDTAANETYSDWQTVMRHTGNRDWGAETFQNDGGGYVASAVAALVSIYNVTGDPQALKALAVLQLSFDDSTLWDASNNAGFYATPTWLFAIKDTQGKFVDVRSIK